MKKKILALITTLLLIIGMITGCGNHVIIDTTYSYDKAQIRLPNGVIVEGEVEKWSDYEGEQLQITIDGVTYLVHSANATLMVE